MERVKSWTWERLRPVRLYLDDIQWLADKLKDTDTQGNVGIEYGGFRYESLDELSNTVKRDIRSLSLSKRETDGWAYLHIYPDHVDVRGDYTEEARCAAQSLEGKNGGMVMLFLWAQHRQLHQFPEQRGKCPNIDESLASAVTECVLRLGLLSYTVDTKKPPRNRFPLGKPLGISPSK